MKSGLSSNQVNDVALDHHGFLLLATDQGLCKYDGRKWRSCASRISKGLKHYFCIHLQGSEWGYLGRFIERFIQNGQIRKDHPHLFPETRYDDQCPKNSKGQGRSDFYTSKGWFMKNGDADNIEPHPFLGKLTGRRILYDVNITPALNLIAVYNEKGPSISVSKQKQYYLIYPLNSPTP